MKNCLIILSASLFLATAAHGEVLTTAYTGNYTSVGQEQSGYQTGVLGGLGEEHRGYVVFNLSGIAPGTIINTAELRLPNPQSTLVNTSFLHTEVRGIAGASYANWQTFVSVPSANYGYIGTATPLVSTRNLVVADQGTTVGFTLNAAGRSFLQSNEGSDFVVLGLTITNLDSQNFYSQFAFNLTANSWNPPPAQLVININSVPEPSEVLLFASLAGVAVCLRICGCVSSV